MKKTVLLIAVFFLFSCMAGCVKVKRTPVTDGEQVVRALWSDFNTAERQIFEEWIAEGFQSVHEDRARNRNEEIDLLVELHLGDYTLNDFSSTQNGNVLVVTYTVAVLETIGGEVLSSDPAERLSVFIHNGNRWKWIAHANLNAMKEQ
ncbi:MAG: nuclear transport factor 2 family protein [Candidatus Marinimicrobia bacterium]|nr:nuclear transport factor 2 family protein [Candidatus Neomarinimicrobiota bacterium]